MSNNFAVRAYMIELYRQHLDRCDFPEEMQKLLDLYIDEPQEETLELIEADYPIEIIKEVAEKTAIFKYRQEQKGKENVLKIKAKRVIQAITSKNSIVLFCMVMAILIFQTCFRYEYHTYKIDSEVVIIAAKIDKLTEKMYLVVLEQIKEKKRKEKKLNENTSKN